MKINWEKVKYYFCMSSETQKLETEVKQPATVTLEYIPPEGPSYSGAFGNIALDCDPGQSEQFNIHLRGDDFHFIENNKELYEKLHDGMRVTVKYMVLSSVILDYKLPDFETKKIVHIEYATKSYRSIDDVL